MGEEKRTIFRRRNIGFIFQSFQLVSELNVEQNIIFPLLLDYKKPNPDFRCTFAEMGIRSRKCFIRFPSQVRQHAVRNL